MALPKLIVVLGTTACGKSGLGVELAKHFGGEIVSADSRQVYRGLDLGTGKVTEEEMEGVPHHMLDVVEPNQPYSVAEFQAGAYAAIDGILSRGNTPFLVGGTGLYVRAVTEGFTFTDARPDPARPRYDCLLLGVTFPRDVVCRRIDERLQARLDAGMVEEVAALRAGGADDSFLEGLGLEYRYILWYLTGKIPTLDALKDELGRAIKRFAKRQMVWFQKDRDVLWLDMEVDFLTQAVRAVEDFLA